MFASEPGKVRTHERFMAGSLAGATAQTAIYPMEVSPGASLCICGLFFLTSALKVPPASLLSPRDAFWKLIHPPRWHAEIDFLGHRQEVGGRDETRRRKIAKGEATVICRFCFTFVKGKDRNINPTGDNVLEEFRNYGTKTNKTWVWCFIDLFSRRPYQWL